MASWQSSAGLGLCSLAEKGSEWNTLSKNTGREYEVSETCDKLAGRVEMLLLSLKYSVFDRLLVCDSLRNRRSVRNQCTW